LSTAIPFESQTSKPLRVVPHPSREHWVVDSATGLVYHRAVARVPYADTDRAGVVYHAQYLRYFELGRTELLRAEGYSYREVESDGYLFPVVSVHVEYLSPLRYDDAIWIYTRPGASDGVRFRFEYRIAHADSARSVCSGSTEHCTLSPAGRPIPMERHVAELWRTFPESEPST